MINTNLNQSHKNGKIEILVIFIDVMLPFLQVAYFAQQSYHGCSFKLPVPMSFLLSFRDFAFRIVASKMRHIFRFGQYSKFIQSLLLSQSNSHSLYEKNFNANRFPFSLSSNIFSNLSYSGASHSGAGVVVGFIS